MTPKDKAKELIWKFYPEVRWKLGQEDCLDRAKQCALIAIDEIIDTIETTPGGYFMTIYWQDVKKEIEQL